MQEKVWKFIKAHKMLMPGERVIVAVSGGADSVCLLMLLAENTMDLRLRVIHVHHGIRGQEAQRDAGFVEELCKRLGIWQKTVYRNVPQYAKEQGLSTEEAARILRYEALEEAARNWEQEQEEAQPVRIAVAHHQDDNAETILHHFFRGSGLKGLAGMQPVQGRRIRPLLAVRRQEIVEYLESRGMEWREDSTNDSGEYTRNRIRKNLIPYLTVQINERAVENVIHAGAIFRQADDYLQKQAKRVWERSKRTGKSTGGTGGERIWASMDVQAFKGQEPILRVYLIREMLTAAEVGHKDITARHLEQIGQLADASVGKSLDLPGFVRAFRSYQEIGIENYVGKRDWADPWKKEGDEGETVLLVPGKVSFMSGIWNCTVFPWKKGTEIPKKEYTKWFDYDKIKDTPSVRHRRSGDFLTLPEGGRKTLKRFLIDEKVPREQRDQIWVLAEGSHVLWVVGYRISEYYKIVEETHTILQVDFYGGKAYGRQDPGIIVRRRSESEDQ